MNIFILISLLRKLSSPSLTCHLSCLTSWPACPWGWFVNDSFSMSSSTWLDWLWIYQVTVTNGKTLLHFRDKQTNNIHFCSNISILKRALKLIFVFSLQKNVFAKFCWTYLAQLLWRIWNCEKFDNQKRSLELKQRKIYPICILSLMTIQKEEDTQELTICLILWKLFPWKLNACSNNTLSSTVHSSGNGVKFGKSANAFSMLCLCQKSIPRAFKVNNKT